MAPRPTEVTVDTWTGRMNEWNECADTGLPFGSAAEARRCEAVEGAGPVGRARLSRAKMAALRLRATECSAS